MLNSAGFQLFANPRADRATPYAAEGRADILSLAAFADAKREITSWPGYRPTPLRRLSELAAAAGVGDILYKDESERFGIGSFKALGGAYAVLRLLRQDIRTRTGKLVNSQDLLSGRYRDLTARITVTGATDGNHGRSVAWGARTFGCRCVIYIHETVSEGRERAIASYGAEVRRAKGTFDDAVRRCAADAAANGWYEVSDTSYEGYIRGPARRHAGLQPDGRGSDGADARRSLTRVRARRRRRIGGGRVLLPVGKTSAPTGRATSSSNRRRRTASIAAPWPVGRRRRKVRSIRSWRGSPAAKCRPLAWRILEVGADAFITIGDEAAAECMRLLADGRFGDAPLVAGESAVAGLAGLLLASADADARRRLDLTPDSTVLVFGTEGATDPELYRSIVGRSPEQVAG